MRFQIYSFPFSFPDVSKVWELHPVILPLVKAWQKRRKHTEKKRKIIHKSRLQRLTFCHVFEWNNFPPRGELEMRKKKLFPGKLFSDASKCVIKDVNVNVSLRGWMNHWWISHIFNSISCFHGKTFCQLYDSQVGGKTVQFIILENLFTSMEIHKLL